MAYVPRVPEPRWCIVCRQITEKKRIKGDNGPPLDHIVGIGLALGDLDDPNFGCDPRCFHTCKGCYRKVGACLSQFLDSELHKMVVSFEHCIGNPVPSSSRTPFRSPRLVFELLKELEEICAADGNKSRLMDKLAMFNIKTSAYPERFNWRLVLVPSVVGGAALLTLNGEPPKQMFVRDIDHASISLVNMESSDISVIPKEKIRDIGFQELTMTHGDILARATKLTQELSEMTLSHDTLRRKWEERYRECTELTTQVNELRISNDDLRSESEKLRSESEQQELDFAALTKQLVNSQRTQQEKNKHAAARRKQHKNKMGVLKMKLQKCEEKRRQANAINQPFKQDPPLDRNIIDEYLPEGGEGLKAYKLLVTVRFVILRCREIKNKPSDYYKHHVTILLRLLKIEIFTKRKGRSIHSVIVYAVILFKDNMARFYMLVLILEKARENKSRDGGRTARQNLLSPDELRVILARVRAYYEGLPDSVKTASAGGQFHLFQGVNRVCMELSKPNAIETLMNGDIGFDKVAHIQSRSISSTDLAKITMQIYAKASAFSASLKTRRNFQHPMAPGSRTSVQSEKSQPQIQFEEEWPSFYLGEEYNTPWIICGSVIHHGIFVFPEEWRHCGIDPDYAGIFGGSGVLSKSKFKAGSILTQALTVLKRIPCRKFNLWAGTGDVHARDFAIDCCQHEKLMGAIFDSIEESTMTVRYPNLNPDGKVEPSHLNGSFPGVVSDVPQWN